MGYSNQSSRNSNKKRSTVENDESDFKLTTFGNGKFQEIQNSMRKLSKSAVGEGPLSQLLENMAALGLKSQREKIGKPQNKN